ncbi:MAG: hypothetical protein L0Y54_00020, partial [Sporichthyaceae bacterium]|nr:hypothetical protein [Sporichthyaceae bacterium]
MGAIPVLGFRVRFIDNDARSSVRQFRYEDAPLWTTQAYLLTLWTLTEHLFDHCTDTPAGLEQPLRTKLTAELFERRYAEDPAGAEFVADERSRRYACPGWARAGAGSGRGLAPVAGHRLPGTGAALAAG